MERECYHVHGKGQARAARPAKGNGAFPWEGVEGSRSLSAWLLHSGELRDASSGCIFRATEFSGLPKSQEDISSPELSEVSV